METSPLKTAQWLLEHAADTELRILDCRYALSDPLLGRIAYLQEHIPGAVYADLETDLSGPVQLNGAGGRHPLPSPQDFAAWLGSVGISNSSVVVCYDDPTGGQGFFASRAWWLLRWLGHREVYVLDGGWPAYLKAGGRGTTEEPTPAATTFTAQLQTDMVANAADVVTKAPEVVLIDSRAAQRYSGEVEPLDKKAGHIPGAVNRPFTNGLEQSGQWQSAEAQTERFAVGDAPTIMYCGSGVSATPNLLARELAGVPLGAQNRLYAGSWSDWVSDDSREIATGPEPK